MPPKNGLKNVSIMVGEKPSACRLTMEEECRGLLGQPKMAAIMSVGPYHFILVCAGKGAEG